MKIEILHVSVAAGAGGGLAASAAIDSVYLALAGFALISLALALARMGGTFRREES